MITFLSDYGPGDEYVGVVHGVIARIAPGLQVLDLGHGVPPQDVRTGARRLARAVPFTPPGVHLAVVDPGVGGPRRAVALRAADRWFVGPDNGLLIDAAERFGGVAEAYDVGESPWRLEPVSATFHGRDIFAPVAAHLALGEVPDAPVEAASLVRLPRLQARRDGGAIVAHALEVDGFGNVRLDAPAGTAARTAGGHPVVVARTFGDALPGGLLLYTESDGGLALAVNGGSAAALLGLRAGDEVRLEGIPTTREIRPLGDSPGATSPERSGDEASGRGRSEASP
ncbi:SAM hydrolase/SAM-dependent halogenase family protein [Candidatus Solirubrobacter pratensis]|uniref:SAM hydrolase/SAM-dependent halogenase family protein n=1 Tax=Candidatus Solirubrobacter pratensis TaxID=1298857 RepID=UPI0004062A65|nr:SAM-dependent chlorinase/fluorinase [Candidatus Solirubrobacter pratensis]